MTVSFIRGSVDTEADTDRERMRRPRREPGEKRSEGLSLQPRKARGGQQTPEAGAGEEDSQQVSEGHVMLTP